MFVGTCVFVTILFTSVFGDVDVDYYYGSGLRTESFECRNTLKQLHCQIKCTLKLALCIQDTCYCILINPVNKTISDGKSAGAKNINTLKHKNSNENAEFKILKPLEIPHPSLEMLYSLRPTVRHHIAHFCPNLEVARQCIRKCMVKGKPAFCGKDHVCYCGHKNEHTANDDDGEAKEIYAQFKDLYKKYFGASSVHESVEI